MLLRSSMPRTKSQDAQSSKDAVESENGEQKTDSDSEKLTAIHNTLKSMEATFSKRLDKIEKRFTDIVGELRLEFGNLRDELKEENREVRSRLDGLEDSLEYHITSMEELEKKQEKNLRDTELKLKVRASILEESLLLHEKNSRKYNLLLYGIPAPAAPVPDPDPDASEGEDQNARAEVTVKENIYQTIKTFLKKDCKMEEPRVDAIRYQHAHRLPKSRGSTGPEPIIVRFVSYSDREDVFQRGFRLPKGKRILSDLPVPMKRERGRLASEAYKIRQEEKLQTRIREAGLKLVLETRKDRTDKWVIRRA